MAAFKSGRTRAQTTHKIADHFSLNTIIEYHNNFTKTSTLQLHITLHSHYRAQHHKINLKYQLEKQ